VLRYVTEGYYYCDCPVLTPIAGGDLLEKDNLVFCPYSSLQSGLGIYPAMQSYYL